MHGILSYLRHTNRVAKQISSRASLHQNPKHLNHFSVLELLVVVVYEEIVMMST